MSTEMNNTTASEKETKVNEPVTDVLDNEPTTTGVDDNESTTDTPASSNADDELIEELSAQLTADSSEGTTEDDEEQAPETPSIPEEPMPSPQECLKKHIGSHYEVAMSERTEEELQPLYTVHSIENMAVAAEKLHREMLPRLQEVQMMQKYQPRQGPRSLKEHWRKEYQKVFNTMSTRLKRPLGVCFVPAVMTMLLQSAHCSACWREIDVVLPMAVRSNAWMLF